MFVAASAECYPELPLVDAIERLRDLEFTSVVIPIRESGEQIKPSYVLENLEQAITICRDINRLYIAGYSCEFLTTYRLTYKTRRHHPDPTRRDAISCPFSSLNKTQE